MTSGVFARLYVPIVVVATLNCVRITFRLYIYGDHEKLNFRNGIVTQKSRRSMELETSPDMFETIASFRCTDVIVPF